MGTTVELNSDGAVTRLTLRSSDGENRIGTETITALRSACEQIAADPDVRVVVVAGEGGFSCGWSAEIDDDPPAALPHDPFGCLAELPRPVIAAIGGDAFSAGL